MPLFLNLKFSESTGFYSFWNLSLSHRSEECRYILENRRTHLSGGQNTHGQNGAPRVHLPPLSSSLSHLSSAGISSPRSWAGSLILTSWAEEYWWSKVNLEMSFELILAERSSLGSSKQCPGGCWRWKVWWRVGTALCIHGHQICCIFETNTLDEQPKLPVVCSGGPSWNPDPMRIMVSRTCHPETGQNQRYGGCLQVKLWEQSGTLLAPSQLRRKGHKSHLKFIHLLNFLPATAFSWGGCRASGIFC